METTTTDKPKHSWAYSLDEVPDSNANTRTQTQQIFPIEFVIHHVYNK